MRAAIYALTFLRLVTRQQATRTVRSNGSSLIARPFAVMPPRSVSGVSKRAFSFTTPNATQVCWQCQTKQSRPAVVCENPDCQAIQAVPSDVNYFEFLDSKPTYDVDVKALRRKFLMLQQKAHPDSYSQASKREHEFAQLQSSLLNKAYNTLKDPLARAKYMLQLEGIQIEESASLEDPELLLEVLEMREELEQATSEDELKPVKQVNDAKYEDTVQDLSDAFAAGDLEKAKRLMIQLQYWAAIKRAILEWAPGKRVQIHH